MRTTNFIKKGLFLASLLLLFTLILGFSVTEVKAVSLQENARIITTPASGGGPQVRILDSDGNEITNFFAYNSKYRGEFKVAVGDVNGDGENEIVVAPGVNFGPNIRVFTTGGNFLTQFNAYDSGFRGGVNIAVGDLDGNSTAEIITAPASHGGPNVRIFGFKNNSFVPTIKNFMAYDSNFHGGVNLALGDLEGDGRAEIITAPQSHGGPHVRIFGKKAGTKILSLVNPGFFAFHKDFRGGVKIAAGDIDLDGKDEIIASVGGQAKPIVSMFNKKGNKVKNDFLAYAESFKGGVNVISDKVYLKSTNKLLYSQGDGTDNSANAILKDDSSSSYTLQTQFKLFDRDTTDAYTEFHTNYFGIYLRFEDINNWMRVDFFESYRHDGVFNARLLIKENGRYSYYQQPVDNISMESLFNSWHTLTVIDSGSSLEVHLDGTKILEHSYSTSIKVGQKGYLSNICTRALWDKLTITPTTSTPGVTDVDIGRKSSDKYGLDTSRNRYLDNPRCVLSNNPYYELAVDSNFSLPENFTRGDGLWTVINDDRTEVIEPIEADPPTTTEKVIYTQGDGRDNGSNAVIKSENSTDYTLATKFKLLDYINTDDYTRFHSTYFGVYLRYEDVQNWIRVDLYTSYRPAGNLHVRLLKFENGMYNSIKNVIIEGYNPANLFSSWHDLEIVDSGSNVSVNLDNTEVLNTGYTTAIKAGMKGYLSNVATRSVWEDMTVTSTVTSPEGVSTTPDTSSSYKYGLDLTSLRYDSNNRYQITKNPYYEFVDDEDYALPSEWSQGDGLWLYMDAGDFS